MFVCVCVCVCVKSALIIRDTNSLNLLKSLVWNKAKAMCHLESVGNK